MPIPKAAQTPGPVTQPEAAKPAPAPAPTPTPAPRPKEQERPPDTEVVRLPG
jgi:hypothetical protein